MAPREQNDSATPIGIDLGTATSEIGYYRHGRARVIVDPYSSRRVAVPSVVALDPHGDLVVGSRADSYLGQRRVVREVKRKMGTEERITFGDREYRPEEISALILKHLKENAERALGVSIEEVVLSVPANFNDPAKNATFEAGRLAGLKIERLIAEPTAAALAYGIQEPDLDEQILVFDFGGGTLDVSIVELFEGVLQAKSIDGDEHLGGKDFDEVLMKLILRRFESEHASTVIRPEGRDSLKKLAEETKIALSGGGRHWLSYPNFAEGEIPLEMEITRAEFEEASAPLLARAKECLQNALRTKDVRPSDIDKVLLVGGSTAIPAVRSLVTETFGKEPHSDVDPDLAVCLGAAVQAAIINKVISPNDSIILADVVRFGLGVEIADVSGGTVIPGIYSPLMPPNQTIPYSKKEVYSLMHPEQTRMEIHLYQDRTGKARRTKDAEDTGIQGAIEGIPPSESGVPHSVEIDFAYDLNGLVRIRSRIPTTGQVLTLVYDKSAKRLDGRERKAAEENIEAMWRQSDLAVGLDGLIARAERALEIVGPEYHTRVGQMVGSLKDAIAGGRDQEVVILRDQLADLLFDIEDLIDGL